MLVVESSVPVPLVPTVAVPIDVDLPVLPDSGSPMRDEIVDHDDHHDNDNLVHDSVSLSDTELSDGDDDDDDDTSDSTSVSPPPATTIVVIPPEVSYAAIRRLNVARNRELLAQLALPTIVESVSVAASTAATAAAAAVVVSSPSSKKEARVSRSDQRDEHYRAPPRRSTSARKAALCGNAACSGFCARCVARVNQPIGAAFASETAMAGKPGVTPLTMLAPVEGEELEKGSVIRVQWRAASETLLRGVALHGYVMLVQVVAGKRAIDDYYFPLVYRPGLIDAETPMAPAGVDVDAPTNGDDGDDDGNNNEPAAAVPRRNTKAARGRKRRRSMASTSGPGFADSDDKSKAVVHVTSAHYTEDVESLTATLDWTCPWDLEGGEYEIEVGMLRNNTTRFARSEKLQVVGAYADLVLCLCGDTIHREDLERATSYVRCERCRCWSHTVCVEKWWTDAKDEPFECPFCRAPTMPTGEAASLICHLLSMMAAFSGGYMFQGDKLARTPPRLVRFLQSVVRQYRPKRANASVLELGAGEGHIAVSLVTDELFGSGDNCFVERLAERAACGRGKCNVARHRAADAPPLRTSTFTSSDGNIEFNDGWCVADYTQLAFLQWLLAKKADGTRVRTFDVMVTNPDFDVGMQTIYVALLALAQPDEHNPMPLVFCILPTDFFEASEQRMRIFRMLDVRIVIEYKLGHQAYYTKSYQEKRTCDSMFVIARGSGSNDLERFQHMVHDVRLQGLV